MKKILLVLLLSTFYHYSGAQTLTVVNRTACNGIEWHAAADDYGYCGSPYNIHFTGILPGDSIVVDLYTAKWDQTPPGAFQWNFIMVHNPDGLCIAGSCSPLRSTGWISYTCGGTIFVDWSVDSYGNAKAVIYY